jgi:hypothetical protein
MASSWTLERFGGLAGGLSKRLPQAVGLVLEKVLARRRATVPATDIERETRRRALRHTVIFAGNSNQSLLDVRWGETVHHDDLR